MRAQHRRAGLGGTLKKVQEELEEQGMSQPGCREAIWRLAAPASPAAPSNPTLKEND